MAADLPSLQGQDYRGVRYAALAKVIDIAYEICSRDPSDAGALHRMLAAVAEARVDDRPRAIKSAPRGDRQILLLYCPTQGGWQTGEWYPEKERWVSNMNMDTLD